DTIVLCADQGCSHDDSSCDAWLGEDIASFAIYDGACFFLATDGEGSSCQECSLERLDWTTGKRTTLAQWSVPDDDAWIQVTNDTIAYGYAYLSVQTYHYETAGEGDSLYMEDVLDGWTIVRVDLETGEQEEIMAPPLKWIGCNVLCASEDDAVIFTYREPDDLIQPEDYDDEDLTYGQYELHQRITQLLCYDLETGTTTTIADTETDGYLMTVDPNMSYRTKVPYALRGEDDMSLYVYDVQTGESQLIVTAPTIYNYWALDGKAFWMTRDDAGEIDIYYQDLTTGTTVHLPNKGDRQYMECSIMAEGDAYFFATELGSQPISKEAFYQETY
ncbi:MAG: hypothetical protein LUC44_02260, partial [Prevotellaceae bacterium]|nr:hypothetical protein [Prevotellaceae bacterium]